MKQTTVAGLRSCPGETREVHGRWLLAATICLLFELGVLGQAEMVVEALGY